jgi:hypothetical protein
MKLEMVAVNRITAPDGLEICLDCWKQWMSADYDRDLGAKTMSGMRGDGAYGNGMDIYDQQQARDLEMGGATDAMIDSLKLIHKWAIYKLTSTACVWNFPRADILVIGPDAKDSLRDKLKNNCCTSVLFD